MPGAGSEVEKLPLWPRLFRGTPVGIKVFCAGYGGTTQKEASPLRVRLQPEWVRWKLGGRRGSGVCQAPAGHLGLCAEPTSQHRADCDSRARSGQTWGITEQGASCLGHSNWADTPRSPARRAARHSMCTHPEILGGFQTWFYFHPEFRDFRIWSDTLKFQDRVKYLLKGLYWCFGEKKTNKKALIVGQCLPQCFMSWLAASLSGQLLPPSCACASGQKWCPGSATAFCPHRRSWQHLPSIGTSLDELWRLFAQSWLCLFAGGGNTLE